MKYAKAIALSLVAGLAMLFGEGVILFDRSVRRGENIQVLFSVWPALVWSLIVFVVSYKTLTRSNE